MSVRWRIGFVSVLTAAIFGIIGLLFYDRYFVPTTLVVCVDSSERIKAVVIYNVHEGVFAREPVNGAARFEKISKGQWKIRFVDEDDSLIDKGEGFFDGAETKLYCPF